MSGGSQAEGGTHAIAAVVRKFWELPVTSKAKFLAIAAVGTAAIYYVPVIRGFVGFLVFMTVILGFFFWLGEGRQSRARTVAQMLFVVAVVANVGLYGRESLTVRVITGTLQSLTGAHPGCTGPVQDPRCDAREE